MHKPSRACMEETCQAQRGGGGGGGREEGGGGDPGEHAGTDIHRESDFWDSKPKPALHNLYFSPILIWLFAKIPNGLYFKGDQAKVGDARTSEKSCSEQQNT